MSARTSITIEPEGAHGFLITHHRLDHIDYYHAPYPAYALDLIAGLLRKLETP